jgi:hypothetical protein
MARPVHNPGQWPRFMRAETAAAYVDEVSVEAFLRKVPSVYPPPMTKRRGMRRKWDKLELDRATGRGEPTEGTYLDAASVL